jgi:hypothetical protein
VAKRKYEFYKTVVITCSECNENIVERADERDVDTLAKAREYARDHELIHEHDEAPFPVGAPWPEEDGDG